MHRVTVRNVDPAVKAALERAARAQHISQSEAARRALARGLGVRVPRRSLQGLGKEVVDASTLAALGHVSWDAPAFSDEKLDALAAGEAARTGKETGDATGGAGGVILDAVAPVRLLRGGLGEEVLADMEEADDLAVSAASLFEVNQKVRLGKLAVAPFGPPRIAALERCGIAVLPLEAEVAARAAAMA